MHWKTLKIPPTCVSLLFCDLSLPPTRRGLARRAPPRLTTGNFRRALTRGDGMWGTEGRTRGTGEGMEGEKQPKGMEGTSSLAQQQRLRGGVRLLPPARTSSCKRRRHAAAPASWEVLLMPKQSWAGEEGGREGKRRGETTKVIQGCVRLQM